MLSTRRDEVQYISPEKEVNAGLWTLWAGATLFLGLRIWCKVTRRTGLWYDDWMLVISWLVLLTTNIIISIEFATGYSTGYWDDRMHILINISSCGTLIGAALSKTALGITLLRMSNRIQAIILWGCIISMNLFMIIKVFFQWAKYCGKDDYQNWYRLQGPCINYAFEEKFKVGGNTDNIIMDFVFACFPWWITWNLEMRRIEKIALCMTMSLGMFVAIISAVRTWWKDLPIQHEHDEYYIWRNGMSNIWYSAEVAGTIIVQCIPILRPFLRDMHTTFTSSKLHDTEDGKSTWRSTYTADGKRTSYTNSTRRNSASRDGGGDKGKLDVNVEVIPLGVIPENSTSSLVDLDRPQTDSAKQVHGTWPFELADVDRELDLGLGLRSPRSNRESDLRSPGSDMDMWDYEEEEEEMERRKGLSPPPPRVVRI